MSGHNKWWIQYPDRIYKVSIPYMSGHNSELIKQAVEITKVSIPYMSGHNLPLPAESLMACLSFNTLYVRS